jgi:peptidoglycan/xylan/chitin deacetylase (PgdA/CDA1 family)
MMLRDPVVIAIALVASIIAVYALVSFVPPMVYRRLAAARLRTQCRGHLVLTYDDGPGPDLTSPLLELLSKHGVKASFFLVGFRAERFPQACDEIARAGHDLGCHTQWHRNAWKLTPWRGLREIDQGYETMTRWLDEQAPFRPPFGKLTTWTWLALARRNAPVCWWTCDARDTASAMPDPNAIVRRVINDGGGVVLMHSHDRGRDRQDYVLDVTERLIAAAKEHDLKILPMMQLGQVARCRDHRNVGGATAVGVSRA